MKSAVHLNAQEGTRQEVNPKNLQVTDWLFEEG